MRSHLTERMAVAGAPMAERGFSLLEVVIAMGVLAFGLLTLALMQMHALGHGSAGRHTADAAAVGRTYVEQIHRVPWSLIDAAETASGWQSPSWVAAPASWSAAVVGPDGGTHTEHSYDIDWRVSSVSGSSCLADIEVRVSWEEQDRSTPKQVVIATRRYNWKGTNC